MRFGGAQFCTYNNIWTIFDSTELELEWEDIIYIVIILWPSPTRGAAWSLLYKNHHQGNLYTSTYIMFIGIHSLLFWKKYFEPLAFFFFLENERQCMTTLLRWSMSLRWKAACTNCRMCHMRLQEKLLILRTDLRMV